VGDVIEKARWTVDSFRRPGYSPAEKMARPWGFNVFMEKEL